jgi:hypothetical protein
MRGWGWGNYLNISHIIMGIKLMEATTSGKLTYKQQFNKKYK